MTKQNADKTHSIRLPAGVADELKAYTGQKLSTLVRWILLALLEKKRREHAPKALNEGQHEISELVNNAPSDLL